MSKIAFLVPHAPLIPLIQEVTAPYRSRIHVEHCGNYSDTLSFANRLAQQGFGILIAQAGAASWIRRSGLQINIVELPVTGFDIIRAITAARAHGPRIAVVAYAAMVREIDALTPLLPAPLSLYLTDRDDSDAEGAALVDSAIRDGADVIVGGGIFCRAAQQRGLPAIFIENGREAILQAVKEALQLDEAIETEKAKHNLFAAVLDYVHDGILTTDCTGNLTSINLRAQQFFHTTSAQAAGRPLAAIWPELSLTEVLRTGLEETHQVLPANQLQVLCNKVPLRTGGKITGALVTFQEISQIQQAEARIRKAIYNKGHIARKTFADVWGASPLITHAVTLAREFALTASNILITGESGTGKEVFAQSIHNHSHRRTGPFVAVNCAALPAQILESELFGYVGGAFTGASREGKPGLFELAHGGTIFLDEIAEMDYANQSRLLRVLQERSVMRLGSDRIISVDVRVVAATNQDLKQMVRQNQFRRDLFFRLNVLKLELPPLRERPQDIPVIAEKFLRQLAQPGRLLTIGAQAAKKLETYTWPGNVRELQNTVERLLAYCRNESVCAADIAAVLEHWEPEPHLQPAFRTAEIQEIIDALTQARGVQTTAARLLGIDRTTLWRKMRRLGIRV